MEGQACLARVGPPHSSRHPHRAHPSSGKPEPRAESLAAASPAQIRVFSQGGDLYMSKLIVGGFERLFKSVTSVFNFSLLR